ncbi:DUF4345 family protein [Zavarzinia compransoris]|uniref:DUF4345 family protein n=1 Tax=Zavarzinia marina TaxID=2911065 RepID=UPI001F3183EB|nr:DUF4345 family protein [Zavarzinia marina]MCF4164410.1 DUF4345 family protein [Zavarzinia marina]
MSLGFAPIFVAVIFAVMGLVAFVRPAAMLAPIGLPAQTVDARNEIQAVYGGYGLAMAAVLIAPLWLPELGAGPAVVVGIALAGMAFGRLVALLREQRIGKFPAAFLAMEGAGAALLLV